ncbi:MAG: hypothetical protein JXR78_11130, partial [Victivallales bacterium]|nr:hypothetical protein [Victivallales bacterium]
VFFMIFLLSGLCGVLNKFTVWTLLSAGSAGFVIFCATDYCKSGYEFARSNKGFVIFFATYMLFFVAPVLCYPVWWDDLTYHLVLPLRWQADGFPAVYADLPYSGYPSAPEFVFWALTAVGGISAPGLLVWMTSGVLLVMLYVLFLQVSGGDRPMALIYCVAFALSPVVFMIFKGAYIEVFMLAGVAAILLWLNDARAMRSSGAVLASGILLGGLCAMKLNGVVIAVAFFGVMIFTAEARNRLMAEFWTLAVTGVFVVAFYSRPWILSGNPMHPFYARFFNSYPSVLLSSAYHHAAAADKFGVKGLWGFISTPLRVCFESGTYDGSLGWQYLLILLLAATGLILCRAGDFRRRGILFVFAAGLIYSAWFFSAQQVRFLLPAVLIVLMLCAVFTGKLPWRYRRAAGMTVLTLTLLSISIQPFRNSFNCWKYLVSNKISLKSYIYTGSGEGYLPAAEAVHMLTPKDAKVLLVFDNRSLYIPRKTELGTPFFQSRHFTPMPENHDELIAHCRKHGISHILAGYASRNPDRQASCMENSVKFAGLLRDSQAAGALRLLWSGEGFYLYLIK